MHSSRMRTAHLLPISPGMHCSQGEGYLVWGVYPVPGGVPGPGGCTWSWGVYLVPGGVPGPGGGGVPGQGVCTWSGGVPVLGGCTWSGGRVYLVHGGGTWSGGVSAEVLPPVNRILDTRL